MIYSAHWENYKNERSLTNRNLLVEKYISIVKHVINMMPCSRMGILDEDDLYSEGVIGLIDAVEKFDLSKNVKFETYAYLRVRGAILDYLRKSDVLSRSVRKQYKEINEFINSYRQLSNRDPSVEEISKAISVPVSKVKKILEESTLTNMVSFESYIEENGDVINSHHDDESPEKALDLAQLKSALAREIDKLNDKEKKVISLYYYEELTFKEIAQVLSLSESRISQILSKVLFTLKEKLQANV
ncbi:MAG: FliA/WhiG family RNA polymerase sigma factor [Clostridia bacterium]|nr:FliA/WhiG family RNA polymerase sigma factor [Clostridia bacterium]